LIINRYMAGGCPVAGTPLNSTNVTDGLANTILVGEKAMDPTNYRTGGWYFNEPIFSGGACGTGRSGTSVMQDAVGNSFPNNWGAAHPSGAQFAFADGSVRLLPFSTPSGQIQAMLTPAGGETVMFP
jgi:prepilin-type processing-associated H-X9-DG protein